LIFNNTEFAPGGNILPVRVIKGSKTVFGQSRLNPAQQANGPSGVMVVGNEAYVTTLGAFGGGATAIPSLGVFSVMPGGSPAGDDPPVTATLTARTTNTPPKRLVVNPMLGLAGAALDTTDPANVRLYLAGFHSNMILVYENAGDFQDGLRLPNRIIAGPQTGLENPVGLAFRPETAMYREALYVVNQSGHSVVVFGGEPQSLAAPELDTLSGDVPFRRYLGAGEGIDPFITPTTTELVSPTGIAIDETNNILYVSNRDAKTWEDFVGRKILAFASADTVEGNMAPTWAIEGHEPVLPTFLNPNPVQTDKTTFKRPSALLLEPDPTPNDLVPQDRLYVANRDGQSVLVFEGVAQKVLATTTLDRNQGPAWRIRHAALTNPAGLALNADVRELYASDLLTDAILAFDVSNLPAANPNPVLTPRVVQGLQTGLKLPLGLALDPLK
jgi:DNA-binding beta-propeller fold protein YncE